MASPKKREGESPRDPLQEPMRAFVEGDYVAARTAFDALSADDRLSDSERATASELARATRVDRLTLLGGLACVGLFVVAVVLTAIIQP